METNLEHRKNRMNIIENNDEKIAIIDDEPVDCHSLGTSCDNCLRKADCGCSELVLLEWGKQEYKPKPLLSGDEADFIRKYIKYKNDPIITVVRHSYDALTFNTGGCTSYPFFTTRDSFNSMEINREYTIEELIGEN